MAGAPDIRRVDRDAGIGQAVFCLDGGQRHHNLGLSQSDLLKQTDGRLVLELDMQRATSSSRPAARHRSSNSQTVPLTG
jgi:hypothetical protein